MMRQIRRGVFETNSSSVHSITMCMSSDYDKWQSGEVYLNEYWGTFSYSEHKSKKFVTKEEVIDILTNNKYPLANLSNMDSDEFEECIRDHEIYTHENYNWDYFEDFVDRFTTPNGDEIVAFGYYGHD